MVPLGGACGMVSMGGARSRPFFLHRIFRKGLINYRTSDHNAAPFGRIGRHATPLPLAGRALGVTSLRSERYSSRRELFSLFKPPPAIPFVAKPQPNLQISRIRPGPDHDAA